MSEQLPDTIKPQSLVDTNGQIVGYVSLNNMKRLVTQLASDSGKVEASLTFGRDRQGIRFVNGTIRTNLVLICQRCMEQMTYPVDITLNLALITDADQAEELPESYEPLLIEGQSLSLTSVIEDELILALPIVAMHAQADCSIKLTEITTPQTDEEKPHPFAALAALKDKTDSKH